MSSPSTNPEPTLVSSHPHSSQAGSTHSADSTNNGAVENDKEALDKVLEERNKTAPHQPVADFLYQLTKMLTDDNDEIIEWGDSRIKVHYPHRLENEVLHKYFRHSKFASFQRQLNYFGFRKIAGKGKMSPCSYVNEAATEDIRSLLLIKRKTNGSAARRVMQQRAAMNTTNVMNPYMGMNFAQMMGGNQTFPFSNESGNGQEAFANALSILQQNMISAGLNQTQASQQNVMNNSNNANSFQINNQLNSLLALQQLQQQQQQQQATPQLPTSTTSPAGQGIPQQNFLGNQTQTQQMANQNQIDSIAQIQALLKQQGSRSQQKGDPDSEQEKQQQNPPPTDFRDGLGNSMSQTDKTRLALEQLQAQLQRSRNQLMGAPLSHSTSFALPNPATAALANASKDNGASSALEGQSYSLPATAAANESSGGNMVNPFESALNIQSLIEANGGDERHNSATMSQLLLQRLPSSAAIFPSNASFENLFNSNARLNSLLSLSALIPGSQEQSAADLSALLQQGQNGYNPNFATATSSNYRANS